MVRFGAKADGGDKPEESESFRDLTRRADETRFDADLGAVETDVEGFGDTGAQGFSSAWASTDSDDLDGVAAAAAEDEEVRGDKRAARLRNLDRRVSFGQIFSLVLVVGLVAAGFWAFDRFSGSAQDEANAEFADEAFLVAPGQARNYAEGNPAVSIPSGWALADTFVAPGVGADPAPAATEDVRLPTGVVAAPLVWGERAHVAIIGPGVGAGDICAVVSLFSADLDVVDVAADGDCDGRFDATGDRLACRSANVVLLEVWPENPGVVGEQPDATRVRIRLERSAAGNSVESLRTTVDLNARFQTGLRELAGLPESQAQIAIGELSESCALLDRADVAVQLL